MNPSFNTLAHTCKQQKHMLASKAGPGRDLRGNVTGFSYSQIVFVVQGIS